MAEEKEKAEEVQRKAEEENEDEDDDEEEDEEKRKADEEDEEMWRKVIEWEAEMARLRGEVAAKAVRAGSPIKGVSGEKACFNCRSRELICARPG